MTPWWRRPTGDADDEQTSSEESAPSSGEPESPSAERRRGDERQTKRVAAETETEPEGPVHIEDTLSVEAQEEEPEEGEEESAAEEDAGAPRPASRRRRRRRPSSAAQARSEPESGPDRDENEPRETRRRVAPARPAAASPGAGRARRNGGGATIQVDDTSDLGDLVREFLNAVPERVLEGADERKIALFCDLENIAIGVRDSDIKKFDVNLVLERLLEKGKIIVKKAYADWERYSDYKRAFHAAAIEMIDIPQKYYSGKNSADIKMVVDAMDLCYSKEHLDTFVILSGDSDFSPLVSKLKENNKYVIGCGVKKSSSSLLVDNCDEFIYYEDVWRAGQREPLLAGLDEQKTEAFGLMVDAIQALQRENKDVLWGSMIKQTMQRKRPSFNEGYYGYDSFSDLLEDAEKTGILKLKKDRRSGSYIVVGFTNPHQ
jgi:uncharacterized protein (TIGR00288 family)